MFDSLKCEYSVYFEKSYEEGAIFVSTYPESQLLGRLGQRDHGHVQEQPRQLSKVQSETAEAGGVSPTNLIRRRL